MPTTIVAAVALVSAAVSVSGAASLGIWAYVKRPSFWNKIMTALHLRQFYVDVALPADLEQGMRQPPRPLLLPACLPTYTPSKTTDRDFPSPLRAYPVTLTDTTIAAPIGGAQVGADEVPIPLASEVDSVAQKNATKAVKLSRSGAVRNPDRPYWISRRPRRLEQQPIQADNADSSACALDPASVPLPTSDTKDSIWIEHDSFAEAAELCCGLDSEAGACYDTSSTDTDGIVSTQELMKTILTALADDEPGSAFPPSFSSMEIITSSPIKAASDSYAQAASRSRPWHPVLDDIPQSPSIATICSPQMTEDGRARPVSAAPAWWKDQPESQAASSDAARGDARARLRSITSAWWTGRAAPPSVTRKSAGVPSKTEDIQARPLPATRA